MNIAELKEVARYSPSGQVILPKEHLLVLCELAEAANKILLNPEFVDREEFDRLSTVMLYVKFEKAS